MIAITIYSVPEFPQTSLTDYIRNELKPHVKPYILSTSQWQSWSMFSPNPVLGMGEFGIDVYEDGEWIERDTIDYRSLPWWRRAKELKITRRLFLENREPIRKEYIKQYCRQWNPEEGTQLRMRVRKAYIPRITIAKSMSWWSEWKPHWKERVDVSVSCHSYE